MHDATILDFFGDEDSARKALIELEFLVEFNSFLVVETAFSPATAKYMQSQYPKRTFLFGLVCSRSISSSLWESRVSYSPYLILGLTQHYLRFFMTRRKPRNPTQSGKEIYIWFLRTLQDGHEKLMLELNRFSGYISLALVYPRRPKVYSTSMIRRTDRSSANW